MIEFRCTVQEGCVPDELRPSLASELARVSADALGAAPGDVTVEFVEIPHGYGFRAGELSRLSSVRGTVPPGLDQDARIAFMRQIHEAWVAVTGCPDEELNVSARDRGA